MTIREAASDHRIRSGPGQRQHAMMTERFGRWVRVALVGAFTVLGVLASVGQERLSILVIGSVLFGWCVLRPRRWPMVAVLPVELTLAVLVGVSQAWSGPPSGASWAVRVAVATAVLTHCEWPRRPAIAWTISATSMIGLTVGSVAASAGAPDIGRLLQLSLHAVLGGVVVALLRVSAGVVDSAGKRIAERRRADALAEARRAAEREYLATLHDTACTTLFMVSAGATADGAGWLPERARRDIESLRRVGDQTLAGDVDLAEQLAPAAGEAPTRVEAEIAGPLVVPAPVAAAILSGVREATQNVWRHAAGSRAVLRAADTGHGIWVELSDDGPGFDRDRVPDLRRGIADSIVGRMERVGGTVVVTSTPGDGTTVRWSFP